MADPAQSPLSLEFPDGSVREFDAGVTGRDIAEGISKSLAKKSVAYTLNGDLKDLAEPILYSGQIEIVTRTDERALELIRHDCAHVLAEAVPGLRWGASLGELRRWLGELPTT